MYKGWKGKLNLDKNHNSATNLTDDRTRLAKERTINAWLRTALSSIAVGLAVVKLFPVKEPGWLILTLGIIFIGTGSLIIAMALHSYKVTLKKLERSGVKGLPKFSVNLLFALLACGALFSFILILI